MRIKVDPPGKDEILEHLHEAHGDHIIEFKTQGIEDEWNDEIDERLRILILAFVAWRYERFSKKILVTHIKRTNEEQDAFYANDPEYQKNPWKSTHQTVPVRAADIRVYDWTRAEREEALKWVNNHFKYSSNKQCLLIHSVGWGYHAHFQVPSGDLVVI